MIYLDTCAVIWMKKDALEWVSPKTRRLVEAAQLLVSPVVMLELQLLYEIKRIRTDATATLADLEAAVDLRVCAAPLPDITAHALSQTWTRDPFDRLIVAHAKLAGAPLLTTDQRIHAHYKRAIQ